MANAFPAKAERAEVSNDNTSKKKTISFQTRDTEDQKLRGKNVGLYYTNWGL